MRLTLCEGGEATHVRHWRHLQLLVAAYTLADDEGVVDVSDLRALLAVSDPAGRRVLPVTIYSRAKKLNELLPVDAFDLDVPREHRHRAGDYDRMVVRLRPHGREFVEGNLNRVLAEVSKEGLDRGLADLFHDAGAISEERCILRPRRPA